MVKTELNIHSSYNSWPIITNKENETQNSDIELSVQEHEKNKTWTWGFLLLPAPS